MHEPPNPMAVAPHSPMRRWTEGARMESGQAPGGDLPGPARRPPSTAHISDAITVLRGKRTRYKAAGKMIEARTVQGCIDLLREVFR